MMVLCLLFFLKIRVREGRRVAKTPYVLICTRVWEGKKGKAAKRRGEPMGSSLKRSIKTNVISPTNRHSLPNPSEKCIS